MIPTKTQTLLAAGAATTQVIINDSASWRECAAVCSATGGQWTFFLERAETKAGPWRRATPDLVLLAGETDTIYLNASCAALRLNATRVAGTADVYSVLSDKRKH